MTVALVHQLDAPADRLRSAWSALFRAITFGDPDGTGPRQGKGPALPQALRGITLTVGEQGGTGVALFDSAADARGSEEQLRRFWSDLAGGPVGEGVVGTFWRRAAGTDSDEPARMIWSAPTDEPADEEDPGPGPGKD